MIPAPGTAVRGSMQYRAGRGCSQPAERMVVSICHGFAPSVCSSVCLTPCLCAREAPVDTVQSAGLENQAYYFGCKLDPSAV
jgi:hypothetical protein